jgi:hypothetical protein
MNIDDYIATAKAACKIVNEVYCLYYHLYYLYNIYFLHRDNMHCTLNNFRTEISFLESIVLSVFYNHFSLDADCLEALGSNRISSQPTLTHR